MSGGEVRSCSAKRSVHLSLEVRELAARGIGTAGAMKDDELPPLHRASVKGMAAIVEVLLEHLPNADVTGARPDGCQFQMIFLEACGLFVVDVMDLATPHQNSSTGPVRVNLYL